MYSRSTHHHLECGRGPLMTRWRRDAANLGVRISGRIGDCHHHVALSFELVVDHTRTLLLRGPATGGLHVLDISSTRIEGTRELVFSHFVEHLDGQSRSFQAVVKTTNRPEAVLIVSWRGLSIGIGTLYTHSQRIFVVFNGNRGCTGVLQISIAYGECDQRRPTKIERALIVQGIADRVSIRIVGAVIDHECSHTAHAIGVGVDYYIFMAYCDGRFVGPNGKIVKDGTSSS
mmetsp:Transcript_17542/g.33314  ORF Transcript_17542/g.33314 Transcript_17542/m.33314 type:complete len:231 (+) Transcript_17542:141-833(+)